MISLLSNRRSLTLPEASIALPPEALVPDAIREIDGDNSGRSIEWRIGPLPCIECDAALMKQVRINLVSNVAKFTRTTNTAVIEIGSQSDGGMPTIHVHDNGVGFDMRYAEKLFGVFQRLHRAEDFEGTGVGLAIVKTSRTSASLR